MNWKTYSWNTLQIIKFNAEYSVPLGYEAASWGNQILTFWRNILSLLPSFSRLNRSFLGTYGPLKMKVVHSFKMSGSNFSVTASYPRTTESFATLLQDLKTRKGKCSIKCSCVKTTKLYYWFMLYKGRNL
jgi:hypothetical protein